MRVWSRILRALAVVALLTVVFAASFLIAVTMREPILSNTDTTDSLAFDLSPTVDPLTSPNGEAVPTTDPVVVVAGEVEEATPEEVEPEEPAEPVEVRTPVELSIDPAFAAVEQLLSTELDIAVRLPESLDSENTWSATLASIDADGYVVHVGDEPDCGAASACRILTFTARASNQANPTLPSGTPVPLPNGQTGTFIDSSCGDGCNNAFIVWIEDGVRYSVGSRVASGQSVLDLAWRSIDTELPTPSGPEACGPGAPKHNGAVARTITTPVDDERSMHWIAVCSALGFDIEIIEAPGSLRWVDVDGDGTHDTVVTHDDGTATIFTVRENRPLGVIDSAGGRLRVGDLGCVNGTRRQAVDRATGERLDYVNATTVRRVADPAISELSVVDC